MGKFWNSGVLGIVWNWRFNFFSIETAHRESNLIKTWEKGYFSCALNIQTRFKVKFFNFLIAILSIYKGCKLIKVKENTHKKHYKCGIWTCTLQFTPISILGMNHHMTAISPFNKMNICAFMKYHAALWEIFFECGHLVWICECIFY